MSLTTVRGVYRNGTVELEEAPEGVHEADVLVTFLTERVVDPVQRERLRQQFFERMKRGYPIGGKGYTNREELYEERLTRRDPRDSG